MAIVRRSAAVMAGAALAAAIGLSPALAGAAAARTWTVKPGGTITGTAPSAVVTDTTNGNKLSCTGSSLTESLKTGSKLPGAKAGSLSKFSLTKCGADGIFIGILAKHTPWRPTRSAQPRPSPARSASHQLVARVGGSQAGPDSPAWPP